MHHKLSFRRKLQAFFLSLLLVLLTAAGVPSAAYTAEAASADTTMAVHFLDVGQGLSILVQSRGENLLYDGGDRGHSSFVVSYLQKQNISTIDYMISSHYDEDATAVFNMLSGYSEPKRWNRLIVAPIWMKDRFVKMIEREAQHAKDGEEAHIVAKMNSLCDPAIMAALYYASSCGVKIDLLVRGICCLKVGIPGISENIHVRSIVGNFLEHSRIFYFHNGGSDEIYMGSADWMPRNLDRRVEIVFPVEDEGIKDEIKHVLDLEFRDNVKAHILKPSGLYEKQDKRGKTLINSQMEFCLEATERAKAAKKEKKEKKRVFVPAEPAEDIEK